MTSNEHAGNEAPLEPLLPNNPYVGPRHFEDNERERRLFFGRERESADLLSLVMADRIVLFYAPSGAGKSSLINARLLPALRDEGFVILGKVRVGGKLSGDLPMTAIDNVYIFNLLRDLDQGSTEHAALATQRLSDYLSLHPAAPEHPDRVLVIDQFEEIFTTYADQWDKREEFFRQLSQALADDAHLWVILAMREDYIAELDPYARLLPNRIRVRYRLQYMGHTAALDAVKKPAEFGGRPFEPGVAENLVNNLRQMSDGEQDAGAPKLGESVEPVQLQVVCMQLWENLNNRPGDTITEADLESLARGAGLSEFVNHALASFYEQTLAAVLSSTGDLVSERELRDWFSHTLITRDGTRNLLYQSEGETGEMANAVVLELERRFLLRGETRGGGRWVELVHDRLVEPILEANEAWRRRYPLVMAAELWNVERSPSLLLTGQALADAQVELAEYPTRYGPIERQFVASSAEAEARRQAEAAAEEKLRKQEAARNRVIAVGATVMSLIMLLLLLTSLWFARQAFTNYLEQQRAAAQARDAENLANQQARIAKDRAADAEAARAEAEQARARAEELNQQIRADQLASQAVLSLANSPQQALLLAVESMAMGNGTNASLSHAVEQSIHDILHATGGSPLPTDSNNPVALVLSPDAQWFALAGDDGAVRAWRYTDGALERFDLAFPGDAIAWALAASPDGKHLAAAQEDGVVRVWRIDALESAPERFEAASEPLSTVAFGPDGLMLAAADIGGIVYLWNADALGDTAQQLAGHSDSVNAIAFSPDGAWLASGGADGSLLLWQVDQQAQPINAASHTAEVKVLAFSPDSGRLASGDNAGGVQIFAIAPEMASPDDREVEQLPGHTAPVTAMDFSANGVWLATGDANGVMRVWSFADSSKSYVSPAHETYLSGLAFVRGAAGDKLVTTGYDGPKSTSVRIWDYTNFGLAPSILRGHDDEITLLATAPGVNGFVTTGYDRSLRVWSVDSPHAEPTILAVGVGPVDELAIAPSSAALYSTGAAFPFVQGWDARNGTATEQLHTGGENGLTALTVHSDGALIAAGDTSGIVHLWTPPQSEPVSTFPAHEGAVSSVASQPTGRLLATAGNDGAVHLWNLDAPGDRQTVAQENARITALQFSPGGDQLAYSNDDNNGNGVITLWTLDDADAAAPVRLRTRGNGLTTIAFSPDGALLAAGDQSGRVWLWDLSRPVRAAQAWDAHANEINTVAFGADRNRLITASADHTVRLWDLTDLLKIPTVLIGHEASVNSVVYADDLLFTVSTDGTLRRWMLAPAALAGRACQVAGRNLYQDEWERFLPETPCRATCPDLPDRCAEASR